MDITKKGSKITITHNLRKGETYKFSKSKKFQTISIFKKPTICKGFSNMCEDGSAILVIDYDNVDLEVVKDDYKAIQKNYDLQQGYLFKTGESSYHVICLTKMSPPVVYKILLETRCDFAFSSMPRRNPYRSYVLRISAKRGKDRPKYIGLIGKEENMGREVSTAHQKLLSKLYPKIEHPFYRYGDHSDKLKIQTYET